MSDYNRENHHGDHHEEIERRRVENKRYQGALSDAIFEMRELVKWVDARTGTDDTTKGAKKVIRNIDTELRTALQGEEG